MSLHNSESPQNTEPRIWTPKCGPYNGVYRVNVVIETEDNTYRPIFEMRGGALKRTDNDGGTMSKDLIEKARAAAERTLGAYLESKRKGRRGAH